MRKKRSLAETQSWGELHDFTSLGNEPSGSVRMAVPGRSGQFPEGVQSTISCWYPKIVRKSTKYKYCLNDGTHRRLGVWRQKAPTRKRSDGFSGSCGVRSLSTISDGQQNRIVFPIEGEAEGISTEQIPPCLIVSVRNHKRTVGNLRRLCSNLSRLPRKAPRH